MLLRLLFIINISLALMGCVITDKSTAVIESTSEALPPLEIYWIDVDGGAATLIVTHTGESILVDAGEDRDSHASRIHKVASQVAGLTQIDHFIATHWHGDHYAGAPRLSERIPIHNIYDRGLPNENDYRSKADLKGQRVGIEAYAKFARGRSQVLRPGDTLPLRQADGAPKLMVKCLAVAGKFLPTSGSLSQNQPCDSRVTMPLDETDNAQSVVLLVTYGRFSFLNTGDLTWEMEAKLICPVNLIGKVDLFQISHHGLDTSNNPLLLESIQPRVVVINNAPKKGPEPNTMRTLMSLGGLDTVWQIHRNVQTGHELNTAPQFVANQEGESGEFIKASVHPDGTFSVQVGQNGVLKEYQVKQSMTASER